MEDERTGSDEVYTAAVMVLEDKLRGKGIIEAEN